ncbi:hypothetical protein BHE74_00011181 [Ensete ventricosum]|nr:hypothetical protein GW17_00054616 [Ensete ventricosum]RWW80477.1 hypothetical protein BHE74_00011181 [Ensete ventricosum]RZR97408.1 hypothetical protein BHM03_00026583 [Ensete ventricosum]
MSARVLLASQVKSLHLTWHYLLYPLRIPLEHRHGKNKYRLVPIAVGLRDRKASLVGSKGSPVGITHLLASLRSFCAATLFCLSAVCFLARAASGLSARRYTLLLVGPPRHIRLKQFGRYDMPKVRSDVVGRGRMIYYPQEKALASILRLGLELKLVGL